MGNIAGGFGDSSLIHHRLICQQFLLNDKHNDESTNDIMLYDNTMLVTWSSPVTKTI